MSRRTRSQRTISPVAASQSSQRSITQEDNSELSEELKEQIDKCVRYFIYRSGSNEPIKRTELKKNVLTNVGRRLDMIVKKAGEILDKVYGFKIVACDDAYITVQNIENVVELPDENDGEGEDNVPEDIKKVLLMLVLANIFMSTNPVNEASLCMYLNTMGIDSENNRGVFGKIKDYLNVTLVKQGYLTIQTNPLSKEATYLWGWRAEKTISKLKILEFVSKIYGDKQPSSWQTQYEEANQQFGNNVNGEAGTVNNND